MPEHRLRGGRTPTGRAYRRDMSTPIDDDESIARPFDQTNGMMPSSDGESDGTAESDTASAADRDGDDGAVTETADGAGALGTGAALRHGPGGN